MSQTKQIGIYSLQTKKVKIGNTEFEIRALTFKEAMGIGTKMNVSSSPMEIAQLIVHLGTLHPTGSLEELSYQDYIDLMNAILAHSGLGSTTNNPILNPSRRTNP